MDSQGERHSRESGNPGGLTRGQYIFFLDASLRWHDGNLSCKIKLTDYYGRYRDEACPRWLQSS